MSIVADHYRFVVGVDTHAATHSYAIIECPSGRVTDESTFPTNSTGLERAIGWLARRTDGDVDGVLIAAEGTGSYGAILAEDRANPGHWEGDLIIGTDRSAIGTLVDRSTRFTVLVHLPREHGWRKSAPVKNGPALSGYGAESMNNALSVALKKLPAQMLKSLTWDRGKEMSAHAALTSSTGVPVFFADPHSPWQRGTNENTYW